MNNNKTNDNAQSKAQQQQQNGSTASSSSSGQTAHKRGADSQGEQPTKSVRISADDEGDVTMGALDNDSRNNSQNHSKNDNNDNSNKVTFVYETVEQHHKAYINALQHGLVTEVYSPPRVVKFARKHKLVVGHSIDITCNNDKGEPWDLDDNSKRHQLIQLVVDTKPALIIGSPMCTMFSTLQNLNKNKNSTEHKQQVE